MRNFVTVAVAGAAEIVWVWASDPRASAMEAGTDVVDTCWRPAVYEKNTAWFDCWMFQGKNRYHYRACIDSVRSTPPEEGFPATDCDNAAARLTGTLTPPMDIWSCVGIELRLMLPPPWLESVFRLILLAPWGIWICWRLARLMVEVLALPGMIVAVVPPAVRTKEQWETND